ncbi:ArsR/SmtB family transcription factor [Cerasicoccus arenae]|uniref:Transcriptional regulator n=1 Tax=Cerasicoccus arenae TaxID=424488 RepID=A0A8J3DJI8_9BACT|nr:metalloregulator ArsR/SmtB family transcription factor [Cerasicoccus arenae]MBK1858920.1 metalloregulator ArsR/SmtB family transcription factor [Cerasicoccus arenae]GHC08202.1 transcriptional regulator [Cerasicoccus arenae]
MASWDTLKLLADATRLRLIQLLRREELSVAELQELLAMGQSRISSHLALLRQGGLLDDRKEGKKTFYSLSDSVAPPTVRLIDAAYEAAREEPEFREDEKNLERVLDRRRRASEDYFNQVAGRLGRNYCPGRSWEAIGHFLLHLTPYIKIADLGAGEGVLSQLLAQRAEQVFCIDNSPRMVEVGVELAAKNGIENLHYKLGDIENVPLEDGSVELALLSQALHHAEKPAKAIAEAYRILKPGGTLVVLDLKEHQFEKAHELYADRWLGFSENQLYRWLKDTGFSTVKVNVVAHEQGDPGFETVLASGVKGE